MTTLAAEPTRWLAAQVVAHYPSAVVSGIVPDAQHLQDGGYHVSINDLYRYGNQGDYSNRRPLDISPPVTTSGRKYAAAHDVSMGKRDMVRFHDRVRLAWLNRSGDSRTKYVNAINCWSGQGRPVRYNFARGTQEPASLDHTWHEHTDQPRVWVDLEYSPAGAWRAARAVLSIVTGQTHDAWQRQEQLGPYAPKPPAPPTTDEDDTMTLISRQLPDLYAYTSTGALLTDADVEDPTAGIISIPMPPAGHKDHHTYAGHKLYLSLAADHLTDDALVRVAINDGKIWHVKIHTVPKGHGGRVAVPVPPAQALTAYNITLGLVRPPTTPDANPEPVLAGGSIGVLVELLRTT